MTWPDFLEDVRHRFDPQSFRNFIGPLAKPVQTGSVTDYHNTFEKYLNRVQGISDEALIPIFVEGLLPDLQEKVELRQPQSLAEAMALALRLGASQDRRSQQTTVFQKRAWAGRDSRMNTASTLGQPAKSVPGQSGGGPVIRELERPKFSPILVSNAEKSERSRKGLCWHCPEKYIPGHVCAVLLYWG